MIDLTKRFNLINQVCFGGGLKTIPVEFGRSENNDGIFVSVSDGSYVYHYIELSSGLKNNEAAMMLVLMHEMVHYWLESNNIKDADHGIEFTNRIKLAENEWGKYQLTNL